ncbi:MAG TPA: YkgJ family cysteine cluster protein [Syntrophobacteria bacterium]|nr:YkgJ family cysteine cluster protein [Syntrophobacteria bacterium]
MKSALPSEARFGVAVVVSHLDDPLTRPLMANVARLFREIAMVPEVRRFRRQLSLPERVRRLHQRALRLYDQYLAYAVARLQKEGWNLSCARGCAACCFAMPAEVSAWELLMIYAHLHEMGRLDRAFRKHMENCQVFSRVIGDTQRLSRSGEGQGEVDLEALLSAYGKARQPCGFLLPSKECLIYSCRPISCRMHFAFTPAAWCDPLHPDFLQAVRLNFQPHEDARKALEGVDRSLSLPQASILSSGLVSLTANVMRFGPVSWL